MKRRRWQRNVMPVAEPTDSYPCEPFAESTDPIIARRTRRVNCQNPEVKYTGVWKDEINASFYEKKAKRSETKDDAIEFQFRGSDVYWRPWKGPDCGLADVFLDGVLQKTVDCWAEVGTPMHYGFIKTGLDTAVVHTIKVVVRGEKNRLSKANTIRHLVFEYAAESYRASDGFSSNQGQNQWRYQRRMGTEYADLAFVNPFWGSSHDDSSGGCQIGYNHMIAGTGDTGRTWIAPHDGTVLIEGAPILSEGDNRDGVLVSIARNTEPVWSARLEATDNKTAAHNLNATVHTGDQLRFIIQRPPAKAGMPLVEVQQNGSGMPELNACKKKPLKIGRSQKEFSHGLSCVPLSRLVVRLPGPGKTFTTQVGVDLNNVRDGNACVFVVTVGDKVAYQSPAIASQREAEPVTIELGGADTFQLDIRRIGGVDKSADWAEATVVLNDGKVIRLADLPVVDLRTQIQWDPVVTYETAIRGK